MSAPILRSILRDRSTMASTPRRICKIFSGPATYPWKLKSSDAPSKVAMEDGEITVISLSSLLQVTQSVAMEDVTVSEGATKFFARHSIEGSDFRGSRAYSVVDSVVQNGSSIPEDTFDIENDTDGFVYREIGTVTLTAGVLSFSNLLKEKDPILFPVLPSEDRLLPEGSAGDMLVHDGTGWVVFAKGSDGQIHGMDAGEHSWLNTVEGCSES